MEKEFEDYWNMHRARLIRRCPTSLKDERQNSSKMNTAGDWLLFIVPVVAMILFINHGFIKNEMINLVVTLVIGIIIYVLSDMLKPYVTGKRNVVDIDKDIKRHFYQIYKEKGLKALDDQNT